MTDLPLILASSSPRRRELLALLDVPFEVRVSDFDEDSIPFNVESPGDWACALAKAKAEAVAQHINPACVIIGADTTVVVDRENLGKPTDKQDALRMLKSLSGRTHEVYTGICVFHKSGHGAEATCKLLFNVSHVTFDSVPDRVLIEYIESGEPMDKAGSYGIQGEALSFIPKVEGDYYNVVGLPLAAVRTLLLPHYPNVAPAPAQPDFPDPTRYVRVCA